MLVLEALQVEMNGVIEAQILRLMVKLLQLVVVVALELVHQASQK